MSKSLTASYSSGGDFSLGKYKEKEPMYQDRYKEFEVVAIKGHEMLNDTPVYANFSYFLVRSE